MDIGLIVPQGWTGEYDGWDPVAAWHRSMAIAVQADALGFESLWAFDHFQTAPVSRDEITFESFLLLGAVAAVTRRVRLGHLVLCAGFRNPALVAKMISTMDTMSAGRMELGIGAGWKEDEWRSYGYAYPSTGERLAALADHLEVITRMFTIDPHDRATFQGRYASVADAINVPKPLQRPRIPVMVGGNGPKVTWRLAARFADEVNLDGMSPAEAVDAMQVIQAHCREIGRDPSSLRVSVHIWAPVAANAGSTRSDLLARYREAGVARVMMLLQASVDGDGALESLADDAGAAGVTLAGQINGSQPASEVASALRD